MISMCITRCFSQLLKTPKSMPSPLSWRSRVIHPSGQPAKLQRPVWQSRDSSRVTGTVRKSMLRKNGAAHVQKLERITSTTPTKSCLKWELSSTWLSVVCI
eukprot:Protomagalhaensia_wolfi_Nauph_80__3726@NODE_3765_length_716_cov_28_465288_g2971_i0_p1_GENE_NODE_3765_length_716_cov_28_465288_g2971_i0NODE_3765_length_716_cov_28_465288_g2971_i0_p1_ORF_typecomplete_len101_score1_27AARP2CN/PF08142_12/0_35_NODE_3765_length_716_cov_28_465288_g2971_i084386